MTPAEARAKLLENGFFTKWEGRYLLGGSEYNPGNPGWWSGIRFSIKLVAPGECAVEVIDFEGQPTELQPEGLFLDLPGGTQKDLAWAVDAVLEELWKRLDSGSRGRSPNVPLHAALEASREHPDATDEVTLLSRVVYMDAKTEASYHDDLKRLKYRVNEIGDWLTEQAIIASSPAHLKALWPKEGAPVATALGKAVAAPSRNIVSCGRDRKPARDFLWAPLSAKDTWPTPLRPIQPFPQLATPHEISTVLFMSAARQVLEMADEWLDLVFFTTEPADGKLTACFLGTKADVTPRPKPQWLLDLGNDAERAAWTSSG